MEQRRQQDKTPGNRLRAGFRRGRQWKGAIGSTSGWTNVKFIEDLLMFGEGAREGLAQC